MVMPAMVAVMLAAAALWGGADAVPVHAQRAPRPQAEDGAAWLDDSLEEQIRQLDTSALEAFIAGLDEDLRRYMPTLDVRRLIRGDDDTVSLDPRRFLGGLAQYMMREVIFQSRLLGQLVVLAVLCALLQNVGKAFGGGGAAEVAYLTTFIIVMYLGLRSFHGALELGRETVRTMTSFMFALLPVLSTLLAAAGALTSAAVFHPLLITVVTFVAGLIETVVFPLLFFTAVFVVAANLVHGFPLSRLAALAKQASGVVLSLALTAFLGVMVVRGALAPVADGVALRAAKFLTGTFVPVVGKLLSDAVEIVAGGALLIKNAIGAFGLMAIMVLAAFPLVKILSIVLIYRLVTAIVQPISDVRLVDSLEGLADALTMVLVAVASVALMFFLGVTVVIGVGHVAMMMR